MPTNCEFVPINGVKSTVTLSVEEFETIRLIDAEGFSQEQCAKVMQVARTTVQLMYDSARKKIAQALVSGMGIRIAGGNYEVCRESCHGKKGCRPVFQKNDGKLEGESMMKIAVTYQNGEIFQHFGHTEQFKIYEVDNGTIVNSFVVDTNGSGHGALAGFLMENEITTLICGGIGGGAQMALAQAGIQLFGGVSGSADEAVEAFVKGNLSYNPDVKCNHHDHEHGEGGHTCGNHGCGKGSCGSH